MERKVVNYHVYGGERGEVRVGDGATMLCAKGMVPYEVIEMLDNNHALVRELGWSLKPGVKEHKYGREDYILFPKPDGDVQRICRSKKRIGIWNVRNGHETVVTFGMGHAFCDIVAKRNNKEE